MTDICLFYINIADKIIPRYFFIADFQTDTAEGLIFFYGSFGVFAESYFCLKLCLLTCLECYGYHSRNNGSDALFHSPDYPRLTEKR